MIEAFPLQWPVNKPRTKPNDRKTARFSKKATNASFTYTFNKQVTMAEACKRVLSELQKYTPAGHFYRVPMDQIVISTNVPVRKDGLPFSNARKPEDPGAAVYFKLDGKDYCLPCDKWDRVEDNIAAIAAHLSALRGIERWGVGESHDAYAGYKALPESTMAESDMWAVLGLKEKPISLFELKVAYRKQANIVHPDRSAGNDAAFAALQEAYQKALKIFNPN